MRYFRIAFHKKDYGKAVELMAQIAPVICKEDYQAVVNEMQLQLLKAANIDYFSPKIAEEIPEPTTISMIGNNIAPAKSAK